MNSSIEATLQKDYRHCQRVIKQQSKSFYYAFSQLPKEKAQAVYAIYAFCRRADDTVDEEKSRMQQQSSLNQLEEELRQFEMGKTPDSPVWRALRDVFNRYPMNIRPFYDQLRGQRMDIDFAVPRTLEELETYSYYVAGTVGLMLLPILAAKAGKEAESSAVRLGTAMQLTNILRDVGGDLKENQRLYLPISICKQENCSVEKLLNGQPDAAFIRVWERLAKRAETLYEQFKQDIYLYDEESRLPVLAAAHIYRGILNAVRKNQYNCLDQRNAVSFMEKKDIYQEAKDFLKQINAV